MTETWLSTMRVTKLFGRPEPKGTRGLSWCCRTMETSLCTQPTSLLHCGLRATRLTRPLLPGRQEDQGVCETGDFPSIDVYPEPKKGVLISENVPVYTFEEGPGCEKVSEANKFDAVEIFGESLGFYHIQRVDGPGIDLWVDRADIAIIEPQDVNVSGVRLLAACFAEDVGPGSVEVCGVDGGSIVTGALSPSLSLSLGVGALISNGTPQQIEGLSACFSISSPEALIGFKGSTCVSLDETFLPTGTATAYGGLDIGFGSGGLGFGVAYSTFYPTQERDVRYYRCLPEISGSADCPEGFRSDSPGIQSFTDDIASQGKWAVNIRDAGLSDYGNSLRSACYAMLRTRNLDQRAGAWREDQLFLDLCVDTARPF